MPELLLEVGCEELPASAVQRAYEDLRASLGSLLDRAGILQDAGIAMGTPRRLIVSFPNLAQRQVDSTKEVRGPNVQAAFKDGKATSALEGFCKSQGVALADIRQEEGYVWATKAVPGRDTRELLAELIPQAIRAVQFDKSMRWGTSRMRFARPIRWILACFDSEAVNLELEGIGAGLTSMGHRFYKAERFQARSAKELMEGLRARSVEPDPAKRRQRILDETARITSAQAELDEELVNENVFLTEWPSAVEGTFPKEYLSLPEPVLVTAMRKLEKCFPVRDKAGKLTNKFVAIRNSGEDAVVRRGYEWVLNARFNDAKFFYTEDRKHSLDEFLKRTEGILFQERLGTVRNRADRLASLAARLAEATDASPEETDLARQAGLYCKADLSTGLVGEMASLQGVIGAEYARAEGMPEAACAAIARHYGPVKQTLAENSEDRTAALLIAADNLDKLAGFLGIGLEPTGSSDPYGLRRAATTLIEVAWAWRGRFPSYDKLLAHAIEEYSAQGIKLDSEACFESATELFSSRYSAALPDVRHDVLEAALLRDYGLSALDAQGVRNRAAVMARLAEDVPFVHTATRPLNIVTAAEKKRLEFDREAPLDLIDLAYLDSPEGEALLHELRERQEPLLEAVESGDLEGTVRLLLGLAAPINAFFDSTMVMVDDHRARRMRLTLMQAASLQLLKAGDFSKITIEG